MITNGEQAYRKRKYAALHAQAGKHGWDDAQTREWLQSNYDVNSATKLSNKQLGQAVGFLGGGFKAVNGGKTLRQRGGKYLGLASKGRPNMTGEGADQLAKIEALLSLPVYVLGAEHRPNVFHSLCIAVQSVNEMASRLESAPDFIGARR